MGDIRWPRSPDTDLAFPVYGEGEYCWQPVPPYMEPPPGVEFPDDLLIPGPCAEGEEGKTGEPGSSVPAEVVDAISTPAEIVDGTVEKLDPIYSAEVIQADVVRTERVESGASGPTGASGPGDGNTPEDPLLPLQNGSPDPPVRVSDALGLTTNQSDADGTVLDIQALPDTGAVAVTRGPAPWAWAAVIALAAAGLGFVGAASALLRRGGL